MRENLSLTFLTVEILGFTVGIKGSFLFDDEEEEGENIFDEEEVEVEELILAGNIGGTGFKGLVVDPARKAEDLGSNAVAVDVDVEEEEEEGK